MAGSSTAIGASLSSLQEATNQISTVSSNIANSDTRGFKAFELSYNNIVNNGGTLSSGVSSVTTIAVDQEGQIITTGMPTDIMIAGQGMIPVAQLDSSGKVIGNYFTRDGSFRQDQNSRLVSAFGYALLAWPLDANGELPQTKSLTSSLQPVNVQQLISAASATTEVTIAVSLDSEQNPVGGGASTIDIMGIGARSIHNERIAPTALLEANVHNSLTQGEGLQLTIGGTPYQVTFDGFAVSSTLANNGTEINDVGTKNFSISVNDVQYYFTATGITNLEIFENLAKDINAIAGDQGLRARVINMGDDSKLIIAPNNINYSMIFGGDVNLTNALGLTQIKQVPEFIKTPGASNLGRFASLSDLATILNENGINTTVEQSLSIGTALTFKSTKSLYIENYQPLNGGSNFLREFGLKQGYIQSEYTPYNSDYNMAGRKVVPHYTVDFQVYDSQGMSHDMIMGFLKTDANKWAAELYAVNPSDVTVVGRVDGLLAAGFIEFDGNGTLSAIVPSTQNTQTSAVTDPENALGATKGQTLSIQVNSTTHQFIYGNSNISSSGFSGSATDLVGNPSDILKIVVGNTVSGGIYNITRGSGANNLEVLKSIVDQINLTSGDYAAVADLVRTSGVDSYAISIKSLNLDTDLQISQPVGVSLGSAGFTSTGTTLTGITGNLTITVNGSSFNAINLASQVGANDYATLTNISAAINALTNGPVASVVQDKVTLKSYLNIQPNADAEIYPINLTFSDSASGTALDFNKIGSFGSALGVANFKTKEFIPDDTTLAGTAADAITFQIGLSTLTLTRGNGTTNHDVLENLVTQINASSEFSAVLSRNGSNAKEYISISPKLGYTNANTYVSGGNTGLISDLGVHSDNFVPGNSFISLYDLAEAINFTSGSNAVTATVVPATTPGTYALNISPTINANYMVFDGTIANVSTPIGTGTDVKIKDALNLKNTSASSQLSSLTDEISIAWAGNIGSNNNLITLDLGTIGSRNGFFAAAGNNLLIAQHQNGISSGNLAAVAIDDSGYIVASFSNGETRKIYKVPVADFANINGLVPYYGNVFTVSAKSGLLNLKEAGQQGAGVYNSGALEGSNVDMSKELTKMIVAQQRYQASTKTLASIIEMNRVLLTAI